MYSIFYPLIKNKSLCNKNVETNEMNEKISGKDKIILNKSVIEQHLKTQFAEKKVTGLKSSEKNSSSIPSPLLKLQTILNKNEAIPRNEGNIFNFEENEIQASKNSYLNQKPICFQPNLSNFDKSYSYCNT